MGKEDDKQENVKGLMPTCDLIKIMSELKRGNMPPTVGYAININIFNVIAEDAAVNIHRWGWDRYIGYVETWRIKLKGTTNTK